MGLMRLNNLKIREKLILVLAVPILCLVYFSISGGWEKYLQADDANKFIVPSRLAIKCGSLLHETQKERGMSTGFIVSGGKQFGADLANQRSLTDQKIQDIEILLKEFDVNQVGFEFKNKFDQALASLRIIKDKRELIDRLQISSADAVKYYTEMNAQFMSSIGYILTSTNNSELSRFVIIYVSLLQEKEWAGLERANLTKVFYDNKFEPGMLVKVASAINGQEVYYKQFMSFATPEQSDFYNNKVSGQFINEIARMRGIALEKAVEGNFGIDGKYWNETKTSQIDLLKEVEDKLGIDFSAKAEEIKRSAERQLTLFIVIAFFGLIVAILLALFVMKDIISGISTGVELASSVARGDLKHQIEINSNDEVGLLSKHLNEMSTNLRGMLNSIKGATNNISGAIGAIDTDKLGRGSSTQAKAVEDIAVTINQTNDSIKSIAGLAEGLSIATSESSSSIMEMIASIEEVAESASSLSTIVNNISSAIEETITAINQTAQNIETVYLSADETSSAVDQFSATLKSIEQNVNESALLSEKVKNDASTLGITAIDKTITGMSTINDSIDSTMDVLQKLGDRSSQIGGILTVINNVTEQTNLLSLNAAIISAQAGEHGKGFGVVAEAIKDLAAQTASSTKDISKMVTDIQGEIRMLLTSMQQVSGKTRAGVEIAKEAGDVLKGIAKSSTLSSQMALEIQRSSKEQTVGVAQINKNITRITEMIGQIAEATKEQKNTSFNITSSLEGLREISRLMKTATAEQTKGGSQIHKTVELVNQKVDAIVHGTDEQKKGTEQITKAIGEIKNISQQNSELASDVTISIDTLSKQVEVLQAEVSNFEL